MFFRGQCKGVKLRKRGPNDNHITVVIETEDDENWFDGESFSSYWLDELIDKLQAAKKYCEDQEPDIKDGKQYGWKFKTAEQKQEEYQRKQYQELKKKFEGK